MRRPPALISLVLALALLLSGCASMLSREYISLEPHSQFSGGDTDPFTLQAENYQSLVNAVLYLVSQGAEDGIIRLSNYARDVEGDLSAACLEVAQEDPLGAYAVDYIKYDYTRIVSYYEASLHISYRRAPEQIKSVVSVTGSSAIKSELHQVLAAFSSQAVLRVNYFTEDQDYITTLVRQAFYDTPEAVFGVPDFSIALYPETGDQRIVEIDLRYPEETEVLRGMREELLARADSMVSSAGGAEQATLGGLFSLLRSAARQSDSEDIRFGTAYAALVSGEGNHRGLAMALHLLCQRAGLSSMVVRGTRGDAPYFWTIVETEEGPRHAVPAWENGRGLLDQDMTAAGCSWDTEFYPACSILSEPDENNT